MTRADTAKTLNFVGKAPMALPHANFTMLCRRASPTCPDHPTRCHQPPHFPTCSRSRFTGVPNYIGGFSEVRELRYSLVHPSGKKGKPFRCSTGRRTMHLRPHSLPHQQSLFLCLLPPQYPLCTSCYRALRF